MEVFICCQLSALLGSVTMAPAADALPMGGVFENCSSTVPLLFCGRSGGWAGHGDSVTGGWNGAPFLFTPS